MPVFWELIHTFLKFALRYRGDQLELISKNSQTKHLNNSPTLIFALNYFLQRVKYVSLLIYLQVHYLRLRRFEEGNNLLDKVVVLKINFEELFSFCREHLFDRVCQVFKNQLLDVTLFTTIEESTIFLHKSHCRNALVTSQHSLVLLKLLKR